ncbi:hypothetical protein ACF0H5_007949 [Mactra antiquata]
MRLITRRLLTTFHKTLVRLSRMNKDMDNIVNLHDGDLEKHLHRASESLLNGNIIAVPTDTIYGIAGLAQNSDAIRRIYDIKKRDLNNPIAISVGNVEDFYKWSKVVVPQDLLRDLLPGPVTIVLERSNDLNPDLNPGKSLVGIRIPNHPFIIKLVQKCGGPIALTSANISAARSTLNVQEFQELWHRLDVICDGGQLGATEFARKGSTVIDLSMKGKYRIIRPGSAQKETVQVLEKYDLVEYTENT